MEEPARTAPVTPVVRVRITTRSVLLIFATLLIATVAVRVFGAARGALAIFVAAAIAASLIAPVVERLAPRTGRFGAIVIVLVAIVALAATVGYGTFHDLSREVSKLERAVPEAARRLEKSPRFGKLARDLDLAKRAKEAVTHLGERVSGRARATAASITSYFAGGILMLFFLSWGRRMVDAAARELGDRGARRLAQLRGAAHAARVYIGGAALQALAVGVATYALCRLAGVPAPVPLALWAALWSVVPYLGVIVGSFPVLLLVVGLDTTARADLLLVAFVVMQVLAALSQRRIHRRSLYVGPGLILVVALLGYELYAIGGAVYGVLMLVFALSYADAVADDEPAPEEIDALSVG